MKKFSLEEVETVSNDAKSLAEFVATINSYGCFIITDCFKFDYIDDVHRGLRKLFSKPEEEKMKYKIDKIKDPTATGFSPYGVSRAMDTGIPNPLETWDIGYKKKNWPDDMEAEGNLLLEYGHKLYNIANKSLGLISIALGVPIDDLQGLINEKSGGMHLIHYFKFDKKFGRKSRRQSKHCDNSLLTLIPPPNPILTGISLYNRKAKKWEKTIINKDECLIQTGLLLQRLTNNKVKANLHTVNNPRIGSGENGERYSTPYFLNPSGDTQLRVFDKFAKGKKIYSTTTVKEVQKEYFDKIFRK
jgi:isopenicillin N synthase-like dioxygenase